MGDRERVTLDEMKREREAKIGEGRQRKWRQCGRDAKQRERRESEQRGGGMRNEQVWEEWERHEHRVLKKKKGQKRAKAELHLEVLSESEDRAQEEKERCVLYAPKMRVKETRR